MIKWATCDVEMTQENCVKTVYFDCNEGMLKRRGTMVRKSKRSLAFAV